MRRICELSLEVHKSICQNLRAVRLRMNYGVINCSLLHESYYASPLVGRLLYYYYYYFVINPQTSVGA
jgi:flavoprotein